MYGTLVPIGITDEEEAKLRVDTAKALLEGEDKVLEENQKVLKAKRKEIKQEIARLQKVDKDLDLESAELEIAVIKDDKKMTGLENLDKFL